MLLLIDAGNTRIKWALADGMTRRAQALGVPEEDGDEWLLKGVLAVEQAGELPKPLSGVQDIRQVWASNVAGEEVARHIRNIKAGQINFIAAREMQCGVRNGYSNAGQLGSDRWAALIAAWHLVRGKCMVVNCGTAITIDTLSEHGEFLGGLILPGVELMQRSLVAATDQLRLEQGNYAKFPLNTADALFSGAIQACCGAIERQYALLGDVGAPVVLSGGAAGILEKSLNVLLRVEDDLVLQGLLLIAQESAA
jgi:type III pantothenate kinase